MKTDLSLFNNQHYNPGSALKRLSWYLATRLFLNTSVLYTSGFKCRILELFGAKIGNGVVIKPKVNIKYPWFLSIGDNSWIGENELEETKSYIVDEENIEFKESNS